MQLKHGIASAATSNLPVTMMMVPMLYFRFRINTNEKNLARAYNIVRKIAAEVEEAAEQATNEVSKRIAEVAARLSEWGSESLDNLVEAVETAKSIDDKGRSLEELCSRLFSFVPGFSVTNRIRTETEEIDISVLNGSAEPRLRREGAIILAECKNWTGKCGKNELVLFQQKKWEPACAIDSGHSNFVACFSSTITKEMLRGSYEKIFVVPMTGEDIRIAVRARDFVTTLLNCWDRAIML